MSLRHALSELNSLVNGRIPGLIEIEREAVRLNKEKCWVDVDAPGDHFGRLLQDLDGISAAFDAWLASERLNFEERRRAGLERELRQLAGGDAAPALQAAVARKLVNIDPTHEDAVRHLMTAFAKMGDRAQAIREYERFRQELHGRLGLSPSKETVGIYDAIRRAASGADEPKPHDAVVGRATTPGQGSQPSIAVLPFRNLSVEAGHDYAAEGLVEDLIESLSHVPSFFVISRLSTLAFRDQHRLPREIGEVLDVRYIISGSMRVAGDRLRLTVELTDTESGAVLWSSKLDERFFDMFEVQGRLAEAIVARVAPHLRAAEVARVSIKRPEHQDAYDLLLRGQEHMHNPVQAVFETAGPLFEAAIEREPRNAMALAWKAYWHVLRVGQGWSSDQARDTLEADRLAARAVECGTMEAMAFAVHGHVAAYLHKDFNAAVGSFETALQINPNSARARLWNAATHAWMGRGAEAVEMVDRAMALSPYDPLAYAYSGIASMAYLADRQYARAIEFALRCARENPSYTHAYRAQIFALVLAGREREARTPARQLLLLEPNFTVEQFRRKSPACAGPLADLYCEALAKVGVPASLASAL
ncbi:MAG TPA: BTAD domain-containing putative transcriptional regulator [Burkholderiaceae bacterium]|nr:BTAD domain-containing putative transcriptional regulator [Burkholderiaceae bacterium]